MKVIIEDNGGLVVEQHECYTYQIKPESAKMLKQRDFYLGDIYLSSWITDSIE